MGVFVGDDLESNGVTGSTPRNAGNTGLFVCGHNPAHEWTTRRRPAAEVDGVGAIATVDQEALQEEQLAIREELQTGNISREEAQQQASELREEFIGEAVSGLAETAAATDGVDVASEYASLGAVVVTGEAAPIIGLLNSEDARALVPRSDVEDQAGTETTESA